MQDEPRTVPGVVLQLRAGYWSLVVSFGGGQASTDTADMVVRSGREYYRARIVAGIVVVLGNIF